MVIELYLRRLHAKVLGRGTFPQLQVRYRGNFRPRGRFALGEVSGESISDARLTSICQPGEEDLN